jgi:hypothetical protein
MEGSKLVMAWTNWTSSIDLGSAGGAYWDIHWMASDDGGSSWYVRGGPKVSLPVVADDTGPTPQVCLPDEIGVSNNFLSSVYLKGGYVHLFYQALKPLYREHYVRFNASNGTRDINNYPWRVDGQSISSMDGFFASGVGATSSRLYAAGGISGTPPYGVLVLSSDDLGQTWREHAISDAIPAGDWPYATGGARSTRSGFINGVFTGSPSNTVYFFRVPADP